MLSKKIRQYPDWKRNIVILWFGTFLVGMATSEALPFLSLYIDSLEHLSRTALNVWTSLSFSSVFLVMAVVSPMWGRLADRVGRKPMLIRSALGLTIAMGMLGTVTQVWQILVLRIFQGFFSGYIANANALIAATTPRGNVGRAMGVIATGATSGTLIGPMLGGVIAQYVGYRATFLVTAVILSLVLLLTIFFVTEERPQQSTDEKIDTQTTNEDADQGIIHSLPHASFVMALFWTTLLVQVSLNAINPIMALYVRELAVHQTKISLIVGLVVAAPGITTVLFAPRLGQLGDRIGNYKVLLFGFIVGILAVIPSAFVTSVWQLFFFRLLSGVSNAAMTPVIQTMLTRETPRQVTSRVFSYNQSFQAMGNFIGPMLGALIASAFSYRWIFITVSFIMIANLIWFTYNYKQVPAE